MKYDRLKFYLSLFAVILSISAASLFFLMGKDTLLSNSCGERLRIVSLSPAVTEILFALELDKHLVGVTNTCDYPAGAKSIEFVGGFGAPNMEKLLSLSPTLIIATDIENAQTPQIIQKANLNLIDLEINSFEQLFDAIHTIAVAAGEEQGGVELVAELRSELSSIEKLYADIPAEKLPRVYFELWNDPVTTAGNASFINELISRAGGVNVAGKLAKPYIYINPEKVVEWDPDVILLCYMDGSNQSDNRLSSRIGWANVTAVKQKRVIADIPADLLLRPGPRLIKGLRCLAQRLHNNQHRGLTKPPQ
jgi:iron complex transport system substrate-binding protein